MFDEFIDQKVNVREGCFRHFGDVHRRMPPIAVRENMCAQQYFI